jgi:hypothetical protein
MAVTDLCDDLTGSIFFAVLVNEVHANERDWLTMAGFGHDFLTLKQNRYQNEYSVLARGRRAPRVLLERFALPLASLPLRGLTNSA